MYLLVEDWTIQQRVERISSFVTFTADRRVDFLSRIAFLLTTLYKASVFSKKELQACYFDIYKDFNLKEKDFDAVITEIESHNGLILQTSFNSLEFAHKSLQEFLTANYINKVSITNLNKSQILRLPNELAIAVALSLNPNVDLSFYILSVLKSSVIQEEFFFSFIARLQLEKPNFTRNPILAVAISFIYEQLIVNSHLTYCEKMMDKLLNLLSIHENIRKCFEELPAYYQDESGFKKFLLPDSEIKLETLIGPFTLVATKQFQELKSLHDTPQTIFVNHTMLKWYFNIDEGIKSR